MEKTFICVDCKEIQDLEMVDHEQQITSKICDDCFTDNYFICDECDKIHSNEENNEVDDYNYCNKCFTTLEANKKIYYCDYCEDHHLEDESSSTFIYDTEEHVCEKGIDNGYYFYCEECGNWHSTDSEVILYDGNSSDDYHSSICDSCVNSVNKVFYCEYHDRYEYGNSIEVEGNSNKFICRSAYECSYFTCDDCGEVHSNDYMFYNEDDYCAYCENCIDNHRGLIKSYHHADKTNSHFIDSDKTDLTFGIELEVENNNSQYTNNDMAEKINTSLIVFESDGSLNNGFEIITQPFNLCYYLEKGKDILSNVLSDLRNNDFISHDTSTCGLHVHVGKMGLGDNKEHQTRTIENIIFIMEYFKQELTVLSRRKDDKINQWSKFYTGDMSKEYTTKEEITRYKNMSSGRYYALNLSNSKTIEFRFFRGTLKDSTFHATLELVNNICQYAKDHEINNLEDLNFMDIITYDMNDHIGEYAANRLKLKVNA